MESDVITLQDLFEFKVERVTPDRSRRRRPAPPGCGRRSLHKFERRGIELPIDLFATVSGPPADVRAGGACDEAVVRGRSPPPRSASWRSPPRPSRGRASPDADQGAEVPRAGVRRPRSAFGGDQPAGRWRCARTAGASTTSASVPAEHLGRDPARTRSRRRRLEQHEGRVDPGRDGRRPHTRRAAERAASASPS